MRVLRVEHEDFELLVECNNLAAAFQKARAQQSSILTSTSYQSTGGQVYLLNLDSGQFEPILGRKTHPVFFENKEYFIGVTFSSGVEDAFVSSKLREVQDKFFYRSDLSFLAGTINFGNDLGKSDLIIRYIIENQIKEFTLGFEVFPTKLDFRLDYDRIVADIEKEYPYLVLDFLKKTYTAFQTGVSVNTDLIWWQVFGGLYEDFLHASRFILNKPHSRIIRKGRRMKADRVVQWTSALEEEFVEFRHFPDRLYFSEYKTLSADTPENRFFKHAVRETACRYKKVFLFINKKFGDQISVGFRDEMVVIGKDMAVISNNPFFKTVSDFRGFKQESLVLQKASGYSNIYRCWVMLNSGLKFLDGIQRIELKNIADLYQIWCFLEMKGILQRLLGKDKPDDVDIAEIQIDDFVFRIERGTKSRVTFRQDSGDIIDLFHDYSYNKKQNQEGVRSYTVNQRPDIVLRISKNDLRDNYIFTYLYDAKYRLQSDENPAAPDLPPDDAINQMHRYRDAIYYLNKPRNRPEKEIIGAYILFPGSGEIDEIRNSDYFRSIEHVNIGAFPLRPNDPLNRTLLEDHLRTILGLDTEATLNDVAPQKLNIYEAFNPDVLIGYVPDDQHASCFVDCEAPFYYTGKIKPRDLGMLKFFAPYHPGTGVNEYYEIIDFEIISRAEIFEEGHPLFEDDNSERVVFRLGKRMFVSANHRSHKLVDGPPRPYRYSKLSLLRNPTERGIEAPRRTGA